jgi:hypothetical protein
MSTRRYWSYIIAATAATVALLSSWLPWYGLRLGVSTSAAANQAKAAGGFAIAAEMMLRQLAGVRADAWQALHVSPAILVAGAIAAGVLATLASSGRLRDRRSDLAITAAGAVALAFVAFHLVSLPGPSTVVRAVWGAYVAAAAAGVAMVAGLVAHLDKSGPAVALNPSPAVAAGIPAAAPVFDDAPPPAPVVEAARPVPAFDEAPPPAPVVEAAPPAPAFEQAPPVPAFDEAPSAAPEFEEDPPAASAFEEESPAAPAFEDVAFAAPTADEAPPAPAFEDVAFAAAVVEAPAFDEAPPATPLEDRPEPVEPLEPATQPGA